MLAEPDGSLWIGYAFGGVSVLRNGRLQTFDRTSLPPGGVLQMFRDRDGNLWVATTSGLGRLSGDRWQIADERMGYSGESPSWLGMVGGHFGVLTPSATFVYVPSAKRFEREPRAKGEDARYGIPQGASWRPDLHDTSQYIPDQIKVDREGSLWLSGFKTLVRYQWISKSDAAPREDRFTTEMGLTGDVDAIMEDREGNIWVGTDKGLDRFSPATLRSVPFTSGAFNPLLIAGERGDVWVARADHNIVKTDESQEIPQLGKSVMAAFRGGDGALWAAGRDGLFEYAHGTVLRQLPLPVSAKDFPEILDVVPPYQGIAVDHGGAVWLSIARAGLFRWYQGSWTQPQSQYGLPPGPAIRLLVDGAGRLWITYPDNQLAVIEGERVTHFKQSDGLNVGNVLALDVEPTHTWVAGDRGVAALIGARFIPLRGHGDVAFHLTTGVVETGHGELWLNAGKGIYRIPATEVRSVLGGISRPVEFETFDWLDGLDSNVNAVRPGPSILKSADGRLWFARYEGVWFIDPDHIQRSRVPPIVSIEDLVSGGVRHEANTAVKLPKNTRNLWIDYTAASLTFPERTRFRYRLSGVNEAWQEAGQRRQAFYTNLGPGQYQFRVMAANKDGVWSEHEAVLKFTVAPAFYQTLVFKICAVVGAALLLAFLFVIRLEQIKREYRRGIDARHAERELIARDVHDTLLQGVQALLFRLQIWEGDPAVPDSLRKEMDSVVKQTKSIVIEGRERILMMRKVAAQPADLTESLAAIGNEASLVKGAAFEISIVGEEKTLAVEATQQLVDIAREAVRNAYQHSGAAHIRVGLQYGRRSLTMGVADDGRGIDPLILQGKGDSSHFGLVGMRERSKQLRARFRVQSQIGVGTRIEVVVPARIAYGDAFQWPWQRGSPQPHAAEGQGNADQAPRSRGSRGFGPE
jgi:signal transduction histidine kinase/sugar lactone lactonase YvrE